MKLTQKVVSKTHRTLVFGGPKSGKTQLVGALSEHFNLLWFDFENGYETLLKLPQEWQERIELVSVPDTKVFPIGIETALKIVTGSPIEICEEHGKVSCALCKKDQKPTVRVCLNELDETWIAVFDSLTQVSNSAMNHLTKNQPDDYRAEWSDYRNQGQLLDKLLSQIQQAKYNVVCITHETETEMEDGKKKLVPVSGTTNFSRNTAKYFDHVVYCELRNKKHAFASATTYSNTVLTGSRTDVTLESDETPSLLRIYKPELYAGEQKKTNIVTANSVPNANGGNATPAQNALNNLKAKLAAGGK
jgi:hypothetical protein